jgi:hypothetical protein
MHWRRRMENRTELTLSWKVMVICILSAIASAFGFLLGDLVGVAAIKQASALVFIVASAIAVVNWILGMWHETH